MAVEPIISRIGPFPLFGVKIFFFKTIYSSIFGRFREFESKTVESCTFDSVFFRLIWIDLGNFGGDSFYGQNGCHSFPTFSIHLLSQEFQAHKK